MKILILLILIVACTSKEIQVGQCIQKPDSPIIFKVVNLIGEEMTVTNETTKIEIAEIISKSDNWGIVNCPK